MVGGGGVVEFIPLTCEFTKSAAASTFVPLDDVDEEVVLFPFEEAEYTRDVKENELITSNILNTAIVMTATFGVRALLHTRVILWNHTSQ
ncbi:MAG: hypothetical protein WAM14_04535 [Candidatus Nitrosopolaris sp.]